MKSKEKIMLSDLKYQILLGQVVHEIIIFFGLVEE